MYARPLGQNTMMTGVPTRFRELSVCNQAEGFLSPAGRGDFCVKLLLSNLSDWLEAKFWLLPGKLDRRRLNWFLFLKINLFLEKMWDVLKGSSTANRQLWQVTATSDIILLVFTKRPQAPNTCSWSPGLTCLFTVCWPSFKQQRSQMSVLRLQSSTWEAEVGISKSRRLVWATEQNPVSKCQKQTNKQTNWRLDSNDQIVRIKPTSRKLYSERHSVLHLGLHLRSTHLRAALDTFIPCPIFTIKPRDRTTSCGSQNIWNQVSKKLLSWDLPRILDSSRVMWMGR